MRFIICILSLFVLPSTLLFAVTCPQKHCLAVVDAGSTGSRLHVFSYDLDVNQSPVGITERWSKKVQPGLSNLAINSTAINAYMDDLFSGYVGNRWPVYVYATGGMRLLSGPKQAQLHALVQNWFAHQNNWQLQNARTISGSEEGLFGWLAVNYQLGKLKQEDKPVGMMDIGGASVQIAFPIKDTAGIDAKDLRKVNLYGHSMTIFVKSFLGLGQDEVTHQFLDRRNCFIRQYELPSGELAEGDGYACAREIADLVNTVHGVNIFVPKVLAANPVDNWYMIGAWTSLLKSPLFDFPDKATNLDDLLDKAQTEVCQKSWAQLNSQYAKDEYLYSYCILPAYYHTLMVDGYGIGPKQALHTLKTEHNGDWTLGVVVYYGR